MNFWSRLNQAINLILDLLPKIYERTGNLMTSDTDIQSALSDLTAVITSTNTRVQGKLDQLEKEVASNPNAAQIVQSIRTDISELNGIAPATPPPAASGT